MICDQKCTTMNTWSASTVLALMGEIVMGRPLLVQIMISICAALYDITAQRDQNINYRRRREKKISSDATKSNNFVVVQESCYAFLISI